MKTVVTLFALLFASIAMGDVGPSGFSNSMSNAGTVKHSEKHFIYVKNNAGSGAALAVGEVVVFDTSADDGVSVTTSATAGAFPACIVSEAASQGDLFRCQTYGLANVKFDVGTVYVTATAGQDAFLSEHEGGNVQATAFASIAASDKPIGTFLDDSAVSGSIEAFLRLR